MQSSVLDEDSVLSRYDIYHKLSGESGARLPLLFEPWRAMEAVAGSTKSKFSRDRGFEPCTL